MDMPPRPCGSQCVYMQPSKANLQTLRSLQASKQDSGKQTGRRGLGCPRASAFRLHVSCACPAAWSVLNYWSPAEGAHARKNEVQCDSANLKNHFYHFICSPMLSAARIFKTQTSVKMIKRQFIEEK